MTEADFEARVTALTEDMYRVAATLLRGHHDRQDAVQECIWKAWRNLRYLRDDAAFRPWLMRILINECYNVKRAHRRISPMAELPERPAPADAGGEVRGAVLALPDKLRLPVVLHYMEGYRVDEIARMLHLPQGTVKSRLRNARARLKDMLGEKGDVDDA